jgi:hypothetical protein
MRKSLWIIPVVLLFAALGTPSAHADSISQTWDITSFGTFTTLGLSPFNSALGTLDAVGLTATSILTIPDGATGSIALAFPGVSAAQAVNPPGCQIVGGCADTASITANGPTLFYAPFFTPVSTFLTTFTESYTAVGSAGDTVNYSGTLTYDYSPVATPESGTLPLELSGLGLVGLMFVMRKRLGLGLPRAT